MYSIRLVEASEDTGGLIRMELFCNRCGVIYNFISGEVEFDYIAHIVGGHRHFGEPMFEEMLPPPYFW